MIRSTIQCRLVVGSFVFLMSTLSVSSLYANVSLIPVDDGFALDSNNDGNFETLNTTSDFARVENGFGVQERIMLEFDISALNGQSPDALSLEFDFRSATGTFDQPFFLQLYAYGGDGQITLADTTRAATFVDEVGPFGGPNDLLPPDGELFEIDPVALESIFNTADYLGFRIQATGVGGVAIQTIEVGGNPFAVPPTLIADLEIILFVDDDASPGGNGASWSTAFNDLQDALDVATSGTKIRVAQGRYTPSTRFIAGDPRSVHFSPVPGVTLLGGYQGIGDDPDDRNPNNYRTILSGDILGDDFGTLNGLNENAYHVVYANGTSDPTAIIDGFYIQNGNANGPGVDNRGGGVHLENATATFRNCRIWLNSGSSGSQGVWLNGGSPNATSFVNCAVYQHQAVGVTTGSSTTFLKMINCVVLRNFRGLVLGDASSADVINSIFRQNGLDFQSDQIETSGNVNLQYSNVEGLTGSLGGDGNIDVDPLFADVDRYDFRLLAGSPCRDAGNSDLLPIDDTDADDDDDVAEFFPVDAAGLARLDDDPCVVDTGLSTGSAPVVDIGMFEFVRTVPATTTTRVYVDADALGNNDGSSWEHAYTDLADALNGIVQNPCSNITEEIWVAAGTYYPTSTGDRNDSFLLPGGISLFGGFEGNESEITQRNPDPFTNQTILSGEINGPGEENNVVNVLSAMASETTATLDGFTIRDGYDNINGGGAGLRAIDAQLMLRNLRFTNCAAFAGGAAYIEGGTHAFLDVTVDTNRSLVAASGFGDAPGLYIFNVDGASFTRCDFVDNDATDPPGASGGLRMRGSQTTVNMKDCLFLNNRSGLAGSLFSDFGTSMDIQNCRFINNSGVTFEPNTFSYGGGPAFLGGDIRMVNCEVSGNSARDLTAGILAAYSDTLEVINCTVFDNETIGGTGVPGETTGAILVSGGVAATVRNTIVWGNTDIVNGNEVISPAVFDAFEQEASVLDVQYSCLQDESPNDGTVFPGTGNIDSNPLLTAGDALRLMPESPCIDAGDSLAIPVDLLDLNDNDDFAELIPIDLDGNDRLVDVVTVVDTGNTDGMLPVVDMGAYEFLDDSMPFTLGDLNCDGAIDGSDIYPATLALVDPAVYAIEFPSCSVLNLDLDQNDLVQLTDISLFVDLLLGRPPGFNPGDMNCDGDVDGRDLAAFGMALLTPSQYAMDFPDCPIANGDFDGSGDIGVDDIAEFTVELLGQ